MGDLISRQSAIELCAEAQGQASAKSELKGISKIWQGLLKLPSSEPKTGRWTWDDKGYFYCDRCGKNPNDQTGVTDFCPNCGARMEVK